MLFSLLVILAVAYVVLKTLNVRAEFARRDAEREAELRAAEEAAEEAMEDEETRKNAVDVEAETIENSIEFDMDTEEGEPLTEIPVIEVEAEAVEEVNA
ncbi:MAG: hypothetical protein E7220_05245 [Clostridiales bacterium]|nr:hypothetical protein [Clostridiales bacterium]